MNEALPPSLDDLAAFAAVAEARSFRGAATTLGVTPSALSHRLRGLEGRLGVRLLHRTTRSVAPTEAGQQLLATLVPALTSVREALALVRDQASAPSGALRITASLMAAHTVVPAVIARLQVDCPRVAVELVCSGALVDIVQEGFDAGVRFGESLQADMVAMPVGALQSFVVVGTPEYLSRQGEPAAPADLAQHRCIQLRFPGGGLYRWQFARDGRMVETRVDGAVTVNDFGAALAMAETGWGLAYVDAAQARSALEAGRLRSVLGEWMPPPEHFYLYYPSARLKSAALTALVDAVRATSQQA